MAKPSIIAIELRNMGRLKATAKSVRSFAKRHKFARGECPAILVDRAPAAQRDPIASLTIGNHKIDCYTKEAIVACLEMVP